MLYVKVFKKQATEKVNKEFEHILVSKLVSSLYMQLRVSFFVAN